MLRNPFRRKKQEEIEEEQPQPERAEESPQAVEAEDEPVGLDVSDVEETVLADEVRPVLVKEIVEAQVPSEEGKRNWFKRLVGGLSKTRANLVSQISGLIAGNRKIDEELLEELEFILLQADVGVQTTLKLLDRIREVVKERGVDDSSQLEGILKEEILSILDGSEGGLRISDARPHTIMVLGVNGVGKTTTIGKLASQFRRDGHKVLVAAGDTFRAAATDQLDVWCQRAGVELIKGSQGSDAASVVFDAIHAARARNSDVLIVDTAGRLHTKKNLMQELEKIGRIMGRELEGAPHEVLLVLDATTGQNAIQQAVQFNEIAKVTGITLTKLDGTAKGGIVIAVRDEVGIPVKLIGIGEQIDDLRDFDSSDFVEALFASATES